MHKLHLRALLPTALALALVACGDEGPQPARPVSDAAAPEASATVTQPMPTGANTGSPRTPFETAIAAMARRGSVHFESELRSPNGQIEYANGGLSGDQASFTIRSLPQPNPELDGTWYSAGGIYMRQAASGYDSSVVLPESVTLLLETMQAFPRKEPELSSEPASMDQGAGISCQARSASLTTTPQLLNRYQAMGVCVDEANGRVIKLSARTQTGYDLAAVFSAHGEPVAMPEVKVLDWSQEHPRKN